MHLLSTGQAIPPKTFTQQECWEILKQSKAIGSLKERSVQILRKVLLGQNGIQTRSFAADDVDRLFDLGPDELNEAFEKHAPSLGAQALSRALEKAGLKASQLDALIVCTCTGYLCPGLSSYISEQLGLKADTILSDIVGQGCGAAIPSLRLAKGLCEEQKNKNIAVVAVEVCSAAFYLDDDPGVLISLCLFADGAHASIWRGTETQKSLGYLSNFSTLHRPQDRETLRFTLKEGKLRNRLHRSVPQKAGEAVRALWDSIGESGALPVVHPGGRDVLDEVSSIFPGLSLQHSANILARHGNLSSPSVMFALDEALETIPKIPRHLWLCSFGAGFSAHCATLEVR